MKPLKVVQFVIFYLFDSADSVSANIYLTFHSRRHRDNNIINDEIISNNIFYGTIHAGNATQVLSHNTCDKTK